MNQREGNFSLIHSLLQLGDGEIELSYRTRRSLHAYVLLKDHKNLLV
jgi:hypothetical protein